MNPFLPILQSLGFAQGVTNRWFSPDAKYGDGVVVELKGANAVACWKGGRTMFEAAVPSDIEKFRQEVR